MDGDPPLFELSADIFHLSSTSASLANPSSLFDVAAIETGSLFGNGSRADGTNDSDGADVNEAHPSDHVLFRHDEVTLSAPYNLYAPGLVDSFKIAQLAGRTLNVITHQEEAGAFVPTVAAHCGSSQPSADGRDGAKDEE